MAQLKESCITCESQLCFKQGIEAIEEDAFVRLANDRNPERFGLHLGGDVADDLFALDETTSRELNPDSVIPGFADGAKRIKAAREAIDIIAEECPGERSVRTWYTLFLGKTVVCGMDRRRFTELYTSIFPTYSIEVDIGSEGARSVRLSTDQF